jgi:hypothetical protein
MSSFNRRHLVRIALSRRTGLSVDFRLKTGGNLRIPIGLNPSADWLVEWASVTGRQEGDEVTGFNLVHYLAEHATSQSLIDTAYEALASHSAQRSRSVIAFVTRPRTWRVLLTFRRKSDAADSRGRVWRPMHTPLELLRFFLPSKEAREAALLASCDIKRDAREMWERKHSRAAIRSMIWWRSLAAMAPLVWVGIRPWVMRAIALDALWSRG